MKQGSFLSPFYRRENQCRGKFVWSFLCQRRHLGLFQLSTQNLFEMDDKEEISFCDHNNFQ